MPKFSTVLSDIPAKDISVSLGIPLRTVYSWQYGERVPSAWIQRSVLDLIKRENLGAKIPKELSCT